MPLLLTQPVSHRSLRHAPGIDICSIQEISSKLSKPKNIQRVFSEDANWIDGMLRDNPSVHSQSPALFSFLITYLNVSEKITLPIVCLKQEG